MDKNQNLIFHEKIINRYYAKMLASLEENKIVLSTTSKMAVKNYLRELVNDITFLKETASQGYINGNN